jgi:hypothetical protein
MEQYVLTVADIQKELHIGKDKAYRLFKQKSFPSFQFDGRYLVTRKDFEHWLEKIKKLPDKNYRLSLTTYYQGAYYGH